MIISYYTCRTRYNVFLRKPAETKKRVRLVRTKQRRWRAFGRLRRETIASWCRRKLGSRAAAVRACAANVYELRRQWRRRRWFVGRRGARALRGNMCQQLSPVIDLSRGRRRRARIYVYGVIYILNMYMFIRFCDLYT